MNNKQTSIPAPDTGASPNENPPATGVTRREALRHLALGAAGLAAAPLVFPSRAGAADVGSRQITLALVGGAHIHAPSFADRMANDARVHTKYVWDPSRETAESRREVTGGEVVDDVDRIFRDPEVDGIVIGSETFRHVDLVGPAVDAGKHLFIEKPVGMNGTEATRIAHRINQSGLIFQTGYFMRSAPRNQRIRELVRDGALGKITRLRLSNVHSGALGGWFDGEWRWMADVEKAGVGAFGDLGSHSLDLLLWFMQEDTPVSCTGYIDQAIARYPGCDEYGEGMIQFASGAVAVVAGGWVDHGNPNEIEISGTEGHVRVTNGELFLNIPARDTNASEPVRDLPEAWKHPLELFFDAVAGQPDLPLIPADQAAQVNRVISAIYRGHETGSWVRI